MVRLVSQNRVIGVSMLESGDPSIGSVSGALLEAGTADQLSQWILHQGGREEDGVFLLELDPRYAVKLELAAIPFLEGNVICVPRDDEMYLELVGVPGPEYAHFFPEHIASLQESESE